MYNIRPVVSSQDYDLFTSGFLNQCLHSQNRLKTSSFRFKIYTQVYLDLSENTELHSVTQCSCFHTHHCEPVREVYHCGYHHRLGTSSCGVSHPRMLHRTPIYQTRYSQNHQLNCLRLTCQDALLPSVHSVCATTILVALRSFTVVLAYERCDTHASL